MAAGRNRSGRGCPMRSAQLVLLVLLGCRPVQPALRDAGADAGVPRAVDTGPRYTGLSGADPLAEGRGALAQHAPILAYRLCERAAANAKQPERRAAALVCQGQAALQHRLPATAVSLGQQALRLHDTVVA